MLIFHTAICAGASQIATDGRREPDVLVATPSLRSGMEVNMRISVGMLLFALFDSGVAFFLVYYVTKAKFGGDQKSLARILGAVLGTLTFITYFAVIVWFNTYPITASDTVKQIVYWMPIVLSILMLILIWLSKPQKSLTDEEENEEGSDASEEGENGNEENEETPL